MKVLILNGSPRKNGNTAALTNAFANGAKAAGHEVQELFVANMNISGCLACEFCHTKGNGVCSQKDDMSEVYKALEDAEMIVIASPIYYFALTGQLQCAINRAYAVGIPKNLRKSALILTSGSPEVYGPAVSQYNMIFNDYMHLTDMGSILVHGEDNKSEAAIKMAYKMGEAVR